MKYLLGGRGRNYDSKKSRETVINMITEINNDVSYSSLRSLEGLTAYGESVSEGPIRSNLLENSQFLYYVSASNLYRISDQQEIENLGEIGGAGQASLANNNIPDNNQIVVLNGIGEGYVYETGTETLTKITDSNFYPTTSIAILNERFWFSRDGTNEFFGSDVSDAFTYNPLTFNTAESDSDNVIKVVAKKTGLYVIGSRSVEYWQSTTDDESPLRNVLSSGYNRGVLAPRSLVSWDEFFSFLADDGTVRLFANGQITTISDLELELKIRGNGTLTYPGFTTLNDAIGFYIDGPVHKIYYLTFPTEGYTWGYDLTTSISHIRSSIGFNFWRANYSTLFDSKIIIGDGREGKLWILDPNNNTENNEIMERTIITPSISFEKNVTIPLIELDMEVGQLADPNIDILLQVKYSKDGGYNYISHDNISLGTQGNYRKRVTLRRFGRLVKNKDFVLKLTITENVRVQYYGGWATIEEDI